MDSYNAYFSRGGSFYDKNATGNGTRERLNQGSKLRSNVVNDIQPSSKSIGKDRPSANLRNEESMENRYTAEIRLLK